MDKTALVKEIATRFSDRVRNNNLNLPRCSYHDVPDADGACNKRYEDSPQMWCDSCLIERCLEEVMK